MKKLLIFGAVALSLAACAAKKEQPASAVEPELVKAPARPVIGGPTYELPRAVIYKMNGDFADNVTVQVDARGNVISYPAPQDVKDMQPVALADGWYLTRRGVNAQTVFTSYTYAEYAALPSAPTLPQLKASILKNAKITEMVTLPVTQSEALEDPSKIQLP